MEGEREEWEKQKKLYFGGRETTFDFDSTYYFSDNDKHNDIFSNKNSRV